MGGVRRPDRADRCPAACGVLFSHRWIPCGRPEPRHRPLPSDVKPAMQLPHSPSPPPVAARPDPVAADALYADLTGVRVLVVDDEVDARELFAMVLESCGAAVTIAGSAAEAFAALRRERPHVLVSDIGMPGEDGHSLIRRVRALHPAEGGRDAGRRGERLRGPRAPRARPRRGLRPARRQALRAGRPRRRRAAPRALKVRRPMPSRCRGSRSRWPICCLAPGRGPRSRQCPRA